MKCSYLEALSTSKSCRAPCGLTPPLVSKQQDDYCGYLELLAVDKVYVDAELFYLLWLVSTGENDLSPSHKHSSSTRCLKSWSISEKLIKWICWVCFPYPSKSCCSACKWQNQQERGLETRHVCSFAGSSWAVYREMHLFISSKPPSSST